MTNRICECIKKDTLGNFFNLVKKDFLPLLGEETSTETAAFPFMQPFVDQADGAADSGIDTDRLNGAIHCASAAFQASMQVYYMGLALSDLENLMRTDLVAFVAADAALFIEFKRGYVFQISKTLHSCCFT